MDIRAWLQRLGLERYAEAFAENDIDAEILPKLTAEDLSAIGVTSVGHRRKLLEAIAALQEPSAEADDNAPVPARAREAERRQLTVLLCDLVGSTALAGRLDPEDMRGVITAYQTACAGVITRFEGHVAKYMGDGVLAYFGYPRAHEDDAERAVRSGLELAAAISRQHAEGGALAVRIGIATGQVVVGDLIGEGAAQEEAVVGETPNLAARLQGIAAPGQIVIAESTRRLLGDVFELADLGTRSLKGIEAPVGAFAVLDQRTLDSRFEGRAGASLLPMVGRDQELALLLERWAQAKAGEGQGVLLVGEAGIGKSRIIRALLDAVTDEPHTRIRYQCSPYHTDSALWPVIQQLSHAAGFSSNDSTDARLDKLEALLVQAVGDSRRAAPLIADLIGLDYETRYGALNLTPQAQRSRTLELLTEQMLGLAARQPVLVVLEDAHWIDPTTLEMIEQGLDRIAADRVVILLTSRPDHQPELAAHPHVTRLTLNRLGRSGIEAIVARLGGEDLPRDIVDTIIARTDGVPLFVEELTKAILETGETTIPASLHDSLMARLDRIPDVKEIAQVAACIGREFSYTLLDAVAGKADPEPHASLDKLAIAQIVFRRGTPPDANYTFKHALVRDAAYQSLLKSRRQELHARIAETLETRFPETAEAEPELVAHHFTAAGQAERAVEYWSKAGRHALERSAYTEAIAHLNTGLKVLGTTPLDDRHRRRELDLQISLGVTFVASHGWTAVEAREAYGRARRICQELGDSEHIGPVLSGIWVSHFGAAELDMALDAANQWLDLALRRDDRVAATAAHRAVGQTHLSRGELAVARRHLEKVIGLYDPQRDAASAMVYRSDPRNAALAYLSHALWVLGYPGQAWRAAEEALRDAERRSNAFDLVHTMTQACLTRLLRREYQAVLHLADEILEAAREHGLGAFVPWAEADSCWARLALSKRGEDIDSLVNSINAKRGSGGGLRLPIQLGSLAEGLAANGRVEQALITIAEALELTERTGERWSDVELHRLKGKIALMRGGLDATGEAEVCFCRALEIAREQSAKSWELRTATSLARLWADTRRRTEAHDLLAPIYSWFTEGFDTADLKDAKALLDDLR